MEEKEERNLQGSVMERSKKQRRVEEENEEEEKRESKKTKIKKRNDDVQYKSFNEGRKDGGYSHGDWREQNEI